MARKKVLIILARGFEEIEVTAPFDILKRAGIDVILAGLSGMEIEGSRGLKILADVKLADLKEEFDALVLPGGSGGARKLSESEAVLALIKKMHDEGKIIAAICASPALVLSKSGILGILKGKKATCYPGMETHFSDDVKVVNEAVVCDGNVITGKGPGTALLFGIKLAEILAGTDIAKSVKKDMLIR